MKEVYVKSDRTKHVPPRFFSYTQDLIKDNRVEIKYVQSSKNTTDLFTKHYLPQLSENTFISSVCDTCIKCDDSWISTSMGVNYQLHSFSLS